MTYEFECLTKDCLLETEEQLEVCSPLSGMCYPDTTCYPGDEY